MLQSPQMFMPDGIIKIEPSFTEQNESSLHFDPKNLFDRANQIIDDEMRRDSIRGKDSLERFRRLLAPIYNILPPDEQEIFLQNPVVFCSKKFLFRGVTKKNVQIILEQGAVPTQMGAYASEAVFTSDSPFPANDFMDQGGALLVFDRSKLNFTTADGQIRDANDPNFIKTVNETLSKLLQQNPGNRELAYTIMNLYDISEFMTPNRPWHTVALRKKQPIEAVKHFLLPFMNQTERQIFNPTDTELSDLFEK